MLKAYKYHLSPTRAQAHIVQETLDRCRELYNAALQERRDAYRMAGKHITYYDLQSAKAHWGKRKSLRELQKYTEAPNWK